MKNQVQFITYVDRLSGGGFGDWILLSRADETPALPAQAQLPFEETE